MEIQLIRNATLKLTYAGQHILLDPDLADLHSRPSFTGRSPNPTVALPVARAAIVHPLDLVLVSHLHRDHFDAVELLPRDVPLFCQPSDQEAIAANGFTQAQPIVDAAAWQGITLTRTRGQHGTGVVGQQMGSVAGFVLVAPGEPTRYWAGDTVLCDAVRAVIARFQPVVIVLHASGARWPNAQGERELIVMDAAQTIAVCTLAPTATVIATHMEALDHATVTRAQLRAAAQAAGVSNDQLRIPADGERITLEEASTYVES